jgi:hypothetical protein
MRVEILGKWKLSSRKKKKSSLKKVPRIYKGFQPRKTCLRPRRFLAWSLKRVLYAKSSNFGENLYR